VLTAAATAGEDVDVGAVIGAPLAAGVLARVLGVPDADRACFNDLADRTAVNLDPLASGARAAAGYRAMEELYAYFDRTLPAVAAADPDAPVARFATDPRLSRTETLSILGLCVVGGYQPLADLPATALAVLPAVSGATRRLAVEPGFARSTVEELLRLHTPIPFTARVTTEAVDLPSGRVPAGARVLAVVAAANRDPDVFERPDEPVLDRTPNPHLALGGGPHLCLGAPLVREVGAVLLGAFARRFPGWRPSGTTPQWAPGLVPRRLTGVRARLR
jgi:cytochrome P450